MSHLEPTGPRWAPCWSHELCFLRGQNVAKPKRRRNETSTNRNVDRPQRWQTKTSTFCFVDVLFWRGFGLSTFWIGDISVCRCFGCRLVIVTIIKILAVHVHGRQCIFPNLKNKDSCRESLYKVFIWLSVQPLSMISINNRWYLDASWCITSLQKSLFRKFLCEVVSAK